MSTTVNTAEATTVEARIKMLESMFGPEEISFGSRQEWEELADHIDVHKYFLSKDIEQPVTWAEAVFSWYDTVYRQLDMANSAWEIRGSFPDKSSGQLYLAISTHWHFLKELNPEVTPEEAAHDYAGKFGEGPASWVSRVVQNPIRSAV